jgi:hypothetical protein
VGEDMRVAKRFVLLSPSSLGSQSRRQSADFRITLDSLRFVFVYSVSNSSKVASSCSKLVTRISVRPGYMTEMRSIFVYNKSSYLGC